MTEWVLKECPGCGRKQPPFLYDEGVELCMGCADKGTTYTDKMRKPKLAKKKLTLESKDTIIDSVKKRKYTKRTKVLEVGELDQTALTRSRMMKELDDE